MTLKEKRKANVPNRLQRLMRLRQIDAPKWVIKSEQVALFLNSKGMKVAPPGKSFSKLQYELWETFVIPYMDKGEDL